MKPQQQVNTLKKTESSSLPRIRLTGPGIPQRQRLVSSGERGEAVETHVTDVLTRKSDVGGVGEASDERVSQ